MVGVVTELDFSGDAISVDFYFGASAAFAQAL